MTDKNIALRNKVKDIGIAAVQCLNSQPQDDMECERHLQKCLTKIADIAGDFRGLVEVEAYDIEWDTDGEDVDLPKSVKLMMDPSEEIGLNIGDKLSDRFGWCILGCSWRMA